MRETHPIPDIALRQHTAILAKTGAGKTTTAKGVVEHVVIEEDARVCILDPIKSDWWGLISSADGTKPGLPFNILGGPHGHVPLDASAGAAVGELVGSGQLPLSIIDMAEFKAGGIQRFFIDFAEALLKNIRGVVYLVIEEAHEFAPKERSGIGAENMSVYWAKKLATAGRSKGIRLIVVSHRVQALHNAVLGSCDTLVAMRLTAPADQKPVIDWLKANASKEAAATIGASLSSLPTGTGWIVSGEAKIVERVTFPMITTFDNSKTPTNDDGAPVDVASAAIDLDRLRKLLAVPAPEGPSKGPKAPSSDPAVLAAAEERGYQRGLAEGIERGKSVGASIMLATVQSTIGHLRVPAVIEAHAGEAIGASPAADSLPAPSVAAESRKAIQRPPAAPRAASSNDPLLAAALSVWPARLTWGALASMCGRKARGGHFNTARKALIDSGLVRMDGELVTPTDPPASPEGAIPADLLEQNLPQPAAKMFATIRSKPGVTIVGLASVLGMQPRGGHWNTGMSTLRRNGLVLENGDRLTIPATLLGA